MQKKNSGVLTNIFIIIFLAIFIGCSAYLAKEVKWRQESSDVYSEVAEDVWQGQKQTAEEKTIEAAVPDDNQEVILPDGEYTPPPGLADLMASNERVKGWIYIKGTRVDYPIMQSEDEDFYLHHDINGNYLYSGSIFLDNEHKLDHTGLKLVYGHHMKNSWKYGTMFRDVVNFSDADYMKEHNDVVVWTAAAEYHYTPVYCYAGKPDGGYRDEMTTRREINQFFKERIGFEPEADDVLVLVTCSYGTNDERTYLICVLESCFENANINF